MTKVYENTSNGFTEEIIGVYGFEDAMVDWVDLDMDGDLDLAISGQTDKNGALSSEDHRLYIYENGQLHGNTPPEPPSDLQQSVSGRIVTLEWDHGTDANTLSTGLSYSLQVGSSSGEMDIVSMVDPDSGDRLMGGMGNVGQTRTHSLILEQDGLYYWSVRSIDNGFMGSDPSTEHVFSISSPPKAPTGLGPPRVTDLFALGWNAGQENDAGHYNIYRGSSIHNDIQFVHSTVDTNWLDTGLVIGQGYIYNVTAVV